MSKPDAYQMSIMDKTAVSYQKLAALRGVGSTIRVNHDTGNYEAAPSQGPNAGVFTDCGTTTFGLQDWLNAQPGVKP